MNYHVALLQLITGTPYAEPQKTFNDLSLEEQFTRLQEYAQKADAYRSTTPDPNAPVFLVAPEYTFAAHPRDAFGDVTHRFLPNATKKQVLETTRALSQRYPKVVFIFSISWLKDKTMAAGDGATEGRNTTYVYYKGEKIFSQHKNGDAGELLPGDTNSGVRYRVFGGPVSEAKTRRQPVDAVFMVDGKPFGIETCCDFGCRLPFSVGQPQSRPQNIEKLEGQFLISATIDHTQTAIDSQRLGIDVYHSDYFFHADGRKDLWEPPVWNADHFSKHMMGAFNVKFDPSRQKKVLKPLQERPISQPVPELSCFSVSNATPASPLPIEPPVADVQPRKPAFWNRWFV